MEMIQSVARSTRSPTPSAPRAEICQTIMGSLRFGKLLELRLLQHHVCLSGGVKDAIQLRRQ